MHPTTFYEVPAEERINKKLSIIMPFFNEEGIIVKNTHEVVRVMDKFGFNYEIILVDDGSADNSYSLLDKEFNNHRVVKVVRNFQNFGKGWALKTGYEFSNGDYIMFLDSDLELSPEHIPNFYRILLDENADAVIGSKMHKDSVLDYPLKRRIYSLIFYTMIKILFGLPIRDSQTGIKLFKREALELSMPKVIVKKFAFDIELLLLLLKNKMKISQAPIELKFSRETFAGRIKIKSIFSMIMDTLAIFYRDKILGFYNRPLGKNIRYKYTFILFADKNDELENESLLSYLHINYPDYNIILDCKEDFNIKSEKLTYFIDKETNINKRLANVLSGSKINGEIVIFSYLTSYPDERFLFSSGRIFSSADDIGGVGGFVTLMKNHTPFEEIAYLVKRSIFLNMNMAYRYKPVNFKQVNELAFDGFFIKRHLLDSFIEKNIPNLKIEYLLSRHIKNNNLKLYYTPDIMLYKSFPKDRKELWNVLKNEAYYGAMKIKSIDYQEKNKIIDERFILSMFLILFILTSIILTIINLNIFFIIPMLFYYFLIYISRLFFLGIKKGFIVFINIALSQLVYGISFLKSLLFDK